MIDGKKKGVYTFITQSGKIESASYLNFSSKKEIDFQGYLVLIIKILILSIIVINYILL